MDETVDFYRLLGVPRDASLEHIKRAYKRLALELHPDKSGGSAERFRALQRAYETLSNPEKRARYDRALERERRPAASAIPVTVAYHDSTTAWLERGDTPSGEILLSPSEARAGGVLPLEIPLEVRCRECHGTGGSVWLCVACDGAGSRPTRVPVALRVPAGVRDGTIFQLHLDEAPRRTILLAVHILRR